MLATNPIQRVIFRRLNWECSMATVKEDFRRILNELMDLKPVSRDELAEALGVSYSTVRDWTNGKILPEMSRLDDLARYFKVDRRDFLAAAAPADKPSKDVESLVRELAGVLGYRLVKKSTPRDS